MSISSVFWMNVVTVWRYDRRYQCNGWYQAWCKWRDLQFTNYQEIGLQVLSINQLDILYTYIHIDRMRCNIGAAGCLNLCCVAASYCCTLISQYFTHAAFSLDHIIYKKSLNDIFMYMYYEATPLTLFNLSS